MARAIIISKTGEANRMALLEALSNKPLTSIQLRAMLSMSKTKLANYLLALQKTGHITADATVRSKYIFKRTSKPFIPSSLEVPDDDEELPQEPTTPYARVIRLLDRPTDPTPRRKSGSGSMYGGMQSGMALFGWE